MEKEYFWPHPYKMEIAICFGIPFIRWYASKHCFETEDKCQVPNGGFNVVLERFSQLVYLGGILVAASTTAEIHAK